MKTQFGWHIIILDDVRESTPPDFEQVKPQLQSFVQKQRVQDFINSLRQGASIEMKAAPVATEPATPDAEPASSGSGEGYPK